MATCGAVIMRTKKCSASFVFQPPLHVPLVVKGHKTPVNFKPYGWCRTMAPVRCKVYPAPHTPRRAAPHTGVLSV